MAYDLLNMKGDIFKYESETQGGAYGSAQTQHCFCMPFSHAWVENVLSSC